MVRPMIKVIGNRLQRINYLAAKTASKELNKNFPIALFNLI